MEKAEKIDIRDLSIGDWFQARMVKWDYEDSDIMPPMRVAEISSDEVMLQLGSVKHYAFVDDLQPIPITAEVLEKNGFELTNKPIVKDIRPLMLIPTHYVYRLTTDNAVIDVDSVKVYIDNRGDFRSFAINCVKYVHELQHALRLAKVGKEIVV